MKTLKILIVLTLTMQGFAQIVKNRPQTSKESITLNAYIGETNYILFENQKVTNIETNATEDIVTTNYDSQNNILEIQTLKDLTVYEEKILVIITTTAGKKYEVTLEYNENITAETKLAVPISEEILKARRDQDSIIKMIVDFNKKKEQRLLKSTAEGVKAYLSNIITDQKVFYVFIQIDNPTTIDYEIEGFSVKKTYMKSRRQQNEETKDIPIKDIIDENGASYLAYLISENESSAQRNNSFVASTNSKNTLVFMIKKLTLLSNENMVIHIFEKDGSRELKVQITPTEANNPSYVKKNSKTLKMEVVYRFLRKENPKNILMVGATIPVNPYNKYSVEYYRAVDKKSKILVNLGAYYSHEKKLTLNEKNEARSQAIGITTGINYGLNFQIRKYIVQNISGINLYNQFTRLNVENINESRYHILLALQSNTMFTVYKQLKLSLQPTLLFKLNNPFNEKQIVKLNLTAGIVYTF